MTRSLAPLLALLITLGTASSARASEFDNKQVVALLQNALQQWGAPGMAVVIVQDDRIVFLQGFGVRQVGGVALVTPDTLFTIASLTKAFAAASLGFLIDDGKASWDDPVNKHLAWFRLFDPLADREVRLRDLLCHRVGLSRHDLLWHRAPWSLEETVQRMRHLEPTHSFRSRYEYNNLAYIALGLAVAKTAGMSWDEHVQKRLLTPLGMKNTVFTATQARAAKDHATPHALRDGKQVPIEWYPDEKQVRASGSIKSSARDMAAWLRLQLGGGVFEGKRLLSAKVMADMHTPQVVVPGAVKGPETKQVQYALGWGIRDHRGNLVLEHGGAADGFRARIGLLPKLKTGFVILANTDETAFVDATARTLTDHLLGLKAIDWTSEMRKRAEVARKTEAAEKKRKLGPRKANTRPSLELADYAGKYRDGAYGEAVVEAGEKTLVLQWSGFKGELAHYHFDTFTVLPAKNWGRLEGEAVTFTLNAKGDAAELRMLGRTFRRVP